MVKLNKSRKKKKQKKTTSSFKSFEKIPHSETVKKQGITYETKKFFNRDKTWLSFNERVLYEAMDTRNPLLERLRFINIFRSNNDEFFMKRISLLIKKIDAGDRSLSLDGRGSLNLYNEFLNHIERNWKEADLHFKNKIIPALNKVGIHLYQWKHLDPNETNEVKKYFKNNIFPILTPLAVDAGHPFPFLSNLSKSIGLCLKIPGQKGKYFARVKIPDGIPQWVVLEGNQKELYRFINIEEVIANNLSDLFPGMEILEFFLFRVTRDASMGEEDLEIDDVMEWVEAGLKERKFSRVVRLEVTDKKSKWIIDYLKDELGIQDEQIIETPSLICYSDFSDIIDINDENLHYKPFKGEKYLPFNSGDKEFNIFKSISQEDHLIHFPYESYKSTVEHFLRVSAQDPAVKAIKITLYRTDADGRLIDILIQAVENGKQVAVVIELTARFDEERNIKWAQTLEDYGIHVTYGLTEFKTHAKMILVVRQEDKKLKTYVNVGTGNFNGQTSKLYTDLSYFTCRKPIGEDVVEVFNYLTGRSLGGKFKKLLVAPFNMHTTFISLINAEIRHQKAGQPAEIIAKMNSLEDPQTIEALYKASQCGVKITLIVRGFCCLKPGIKGLSEHIKVISLVGRLLEHSRIYYFRSGEKVKSHGKFYLGSSDWMSRNLYRRVEVITPILALKLKQKMWKILEMNIKDNLNAWELKSNGNYVKKSVEIKKLDSQEWFIQNKKGIL